MKESFLLFSTLSNVYDTFQMTGQLQCRQRLVNIGGMNYPLPYPPYPPLSPPIPPPISLTLTPPPSPSHYPFPIPSP